MKKLISILCSVALSFGLVSCSEQKSAKGDEDKTNLPSVTCGSVAPDFEISDANGYTFKLSDYRGKWVLLDFWASWCPDCVAEIPAMKGLYHDFDARGVNFISVSFDKEEQAWKDCISSNGFEWRQGCNLKEWKENPIAEAYGIHWIPTTILIAPDGTVAGAALTAEEMRTILDEKIGIMPVTGTWINLAWQDERNNYMNFQDEDKNTDPGMWAEKMRNLHAIGVDYIAFDQVANERKAYYPSEIMPHHYPDGRKSPVEVIMDTCDELGMHVFMSCGWANNQLDDVGNKEVVARQCAMMEELAALYGDRPSFYGWYLPIEDCLIPYLPDRSVEGINNLIAKAHQVTPGKYTMVAPYGIFGADLDTPKFGEQLSKIDVDIIAYQDEIGCVRKTFPIHQMKENFRKLGEIHKNLDIEFWVNIENFTWDRGTNNWYSTLIPAEFGRYLTQIVSANQSGATRIMSFSVYGIYDRPGSQYPLGQPVESNLAYSTYQDWLAGDPHWKLLEDVYMGDAANIAEGSTCDFPTLVDGIYGYESPDCTEWTSFDGDMEIVIDLGKKTEIEAVAPHFMHFAGRGVKMPVSVELYTSNNGKKYTAVQTVDGPHAVNDRHDCWTDLTYFALNKKARYIKVIAKAAESSSIYCDEIILK